MDNKPSSNPLQLVERIRHAAAYPYAEGVLNLARCLCRAADRIEKLEAALREIAEAKFDGGYPGAALAACQTIARAALEPERREGEE